MDIAERLIKIRGTHSRRAFADLLEIPESTLRNYEFGRSLPNTDFVVTLCEKLGVTSDWLLFGDSLQLKDAQTQLPNDLTVTETNKDIETTTSKDTEYALIPMVDAVLSAGTGSFEVSSSGDRKYAFRNDFLHRKGNIKDMVLMRVSGDSMEPRILDGDAVLIDQSQQQLMANAVYAVGFEDMVYLKKINAQPNKLILSSFNKEYSPIEINMCEDLDDQVRIIGRVVWLCREL